MKALANKNILVTRDAKGAADFATQLKKEDAHPINLPLLSIECLSSTRDVDMSEGVWVFFTSQNGVECFLKNQKFAASLHHCRIAAVGSKTATALEKRGYKVDFIPSLFNAKTMAKEFLASYETTKPVLFVRGVIARRTLLDAFTQAQRPFQCLEVYDTTINWEVKAPLQRALDEKNIDYLTFASPSAVDAFMTLVEEAERFQALPTVCIGTTTEKQAITRGFTNTIIPEKFTIEAMIHAMQADCIQKGRRST